MRLRSRRPRRPPLTTWLGWLGVIAVVAVVANVIAYLDTLPPALATSGPRRPDQEQ